MKRTWALVLLASAALSGSFVAWNEVRQEREFRRLIALGDAALAEDRTFVAVEAFSGAVVLKPDSMLAWLKRGDTYRRRGELPAALRDLSQAAALDPAATRPLELLGDVNLAMQRHPRAAEYYGRFVALDDRSPRVLYKLALARYRDGRAAAALEPLRQALKFDAGSSEAHYLLALCLREREGDAAAATPLRRAVELNPAFAAARAELADVYAALGRTRARIEQLEALAAIEAARPEGLVAVGLAYARLGRTDAAVLTLGRAAERFPDAPAVYAALGEVWLDSAVERGDRSALRKALEALQPFAAREDAGGETLSLYGRALFLAGDSEGARSALARAAAKLPVDPSAFLYLAAAARRLRRAGEAADALAAYAALARIDRGAAVTGVQDAIAQQRRLRLPPSALRHASSGRS
jgi:tetratricopeptide (TPR) repeat protein